MSNLFQTFGLGLQGGVYIPKIKHRILTPKRDKLTHLFNEKTILSKSAYRQQWSRSF